MPEATAEPHFCKGTINGAQLPFKKIANKRSWFYSGNSNSSGTINYLQLLGDISKDSTARSTGKERVDRGLLDPGSYMRLTSHMHSLLEAPATVALPLRQLRGQSTGFLYFGKGAHGYSLLVTATDYAVVRHTDWLRGHAITAQTPRTSQLLPWLADHKLAPDTGLLWVAKATSELNSSDLQAFASV